MVKNGIFYAILADFGTLKKLFFRRGSKPRAKNWPFSVIFCPLQAKLGKKEFKEGIKLKTGKKPVFRT